MWAGFFMLGLWTMLPWNVFIMTSICFTNHLGITLNMSLTLFSLLGMFIPHLLHGWPSGKKFP